RHCEFPIAFPARSSITARGFLPWSLSDAGLRRAPPPSSSGRHPKCYTAGDKAFADWLARF
ncbi:MAG: hypothetical protein KJ587_18745, partial [Alphaproteobacteria bacterium]|nr:hypothetical protein [Alphaproteobacteria bacterium]